MKRICAVALICMLAVSALAACSPAEVASDISVVSREEGSGTRGAFIELFGVEVKDDDGSKKDMTTKEAVIADKTAVMMTNVANDPLAIGYCSLGSLNDTVKALQIDGVAATVENIKNGSYVIQRPFNIAVKGEPDGLAGDFIGFILSKEGQEAIVEHGCVAISDDAPAFSGELPSGELVVGGSSSVSPVMEKLKEAYIALNPGAKITIDENDSSSGLTDAINGTCDIGMASRDLKDSELAELSAITIAIDGIAVIVNNQNQTSGLSKEQVKSIYLGQTRQWSGVR